MHRFFAIFLGLFTSWTFSVQLVMAMQKSLYVLYICFPIVTVFLCSLFFIVSKIQIVQFYPISTPSVCSFEKISNQGWLYCFFIGVFTSIFLLVINWKLFWLFSIIFLSITLFYISKKVPDVVQKESLKISRVQKIIVSVTIVTSVLLTLFVSRSDLDDTFYASIPAFIVANPDAPILATDAMFGEKTLPILFPSYKFTSFEVLSGALAYGLNIHAATAYYILLPPLLAIFIVIVTFLLSRELMPDRWHWLGIVAIFLVLLLGEAPRSPANFYFFRIFQGKAAFVSIIVPAIFYLSMRYFSSRGNYCDAFLLACCQICAIGFSNFGMMAAPLVMVCALAANFPLIVSQSKRKIIIFGLILLIPSPYLLYMLTQLKNVVLFNYPTEPPHSVWVTVFGEHQQYLFVLLLLMGPLLAPNKLLAIRLSAPVLILLGLFLNPYFADFISQKIMRPEIYWRVIWSFPIIIYSAVSIIFIFDALINRKGKAFYLSAFILLCLLVISLPYHTLRKENAAIEWEFAGLKIPKEKLAVALKAIEFSDTCCRVLAPAEISGVITRFENHPKLIMTRTPYLDVLAKSFEGDQYKNRHLLQNFVSCGTDINFSQARESLEKLRVNVIVLQKQCDSSAISEFLEVEGFKLKHQIGDYDLYKINTDPLTSTSVSVVN